MYYIWVTKLCAHRVFKKNEAMSVHRGVLHALSAGQNSLPTFATLAQQNRTNVSICALTTSHMIQKVFFNSRQMFVLV